MSKVKTAVLDVLSDGNWHLMADIFEQVSKRCRTNRRNVEGVISTLSGGHHIIKEHVDNQYLVCRYRLKDKSAGFGVSQQMATLNELLKAARGNHATH
ncbi:hypothetical protein [Pantoea vagans]|uniref:hypothetical protein n=1 Tax=Pantoea vagans TaxID=470934 RepID=UPI0028AD919D|nr:hypothetical protein [Pantoea vagans]